MTIKREQQRQISAKAVHDTAMHQLLYAIPDDAVRAFEASIEGGIVAIRQHLETADNHDDRASRLEGVNEAASALKYLFDLRLNRL